MIGVYYLSCTVRATFEIYCLNVILYYTSKYYCPLPHILMVFTSHVLAIFIVFSVIEYCLKHVEDLYT